MIPHRIPGFISFHCWDFQRVFSTITVSTLLGIPTCYICRLIDKKKNHNASIYGSMLILVIAFAFAILMPVVSVNASGKPAIFHGITIGEKYTKETFCHENFTIKSIEKKTQFELCWNKNDALYSHNICEFYTIENHYGIYVQMIRKIPDTISESSTVHTGFFQDYTKEIKHYDSLNSSAKK